VKEGKYLLRKLWLPVLLCGLLLAGCIRVPSLQDLAVVQGVAADYADGKYELTLQLLDTGSSGGGNTAPAQNVRTVSCTGSTVAEALAQTSLSQGQSFFPGHDRVLILGEGTRELELSLLLQELAGSLGLREDVVVLSSDGKAGDVLNLKSDQGILPSMTIEQTVENAAREGKNLETRLLEAERSLTENRPAVFPVISLPEEGGSFMLSGAVAAEEGGIYELEGDLLSGLLFFRDRVRSMEFIVEDKSVRLYRCRTKLLPDFSEESSMLLKIEAKAMLPAPANSVSDEQLKHLEQMTEEKIEACCDKIFAVAAEKTAGDLLGLGQVLRRYRPEFFNEDQAEENNPIDKIGMKYAVTVRIDQFREN